MPRFLTLIALLSWSTLACAQVLAPPHEDKQDRITPTTTDDSILTTKKDTAAPAAAPTDMLKQPDMPSGVSPFQHAPVDALDAPKAAAAAPTTLPFKAPAAPLAAAGDAAKPASFQAKSPFGKGEAATMPQVPSGPHKSEAMPVVNVDSVEASEPAPPTPVEPEADPAQANPADPTELTSPIFGEEENKLAPRKIILRALNKVTAQSELLTLKPGEKVTFGQLEIIAVNCQVSSPTSQTDYAGLLDISEKAPGGTTIKPLFKGWMYASSSSITALEHPVYDISMAECRMMPHTEKAAEKAEKPEKSEKKPASKPKR